MSGSYSDLVSFSIMTHPTTLNYSVRCLVGVLAMESSSFRLKVQSCVITMLCKRQYLGTVYSLVDARADYFKTQSKKKKINDPLVDMNIPHSLATNAETSYFHCLN